MVVMDSDCLGSFDEVPESALMLLTSLVLLAILDDKVLKVYPLLLGDVSLPLHLDSGVYVLPVAYNDSMEPDDDEEQHYKEPADEFQRIGPVVVISPQHSCIQDLCPLRPQAKTAVAGSRVRLCHHVRTAGVQRFGRRNLNPIRFPNMTRCLGCDCLRCLWVVHY